MSEAAIVAESTSKLAADIDGLLLGFMASQVICSGFKFRIPQLCAQRARSLTFLSTTTGCVSEKLSILLAALVRLGLLSYDERSSEYTATAACRLLLDPASATSPAAFSIHELYFPAWAQLSKALLTSTPGVELAFGSGVFDLLDRDDALRRAVHRMADIDTLRLTAHPIELIFEDLTAKSIIDIAGGSGLFLTWVLENSAASSGTLFERRSMVADSPGRSARQMEFQVGDVFESLPTGFDVYVMKSFLHDMTDSEVARVFVNARRAMEASSRLVVIERLAATSNVNEWDWSGLAHALDLIVSFGLPPRTQGDYERLFGQAGMSLLRASRHPSGYTVMCAGARDAR